MDIVALCQLVNMALPGSIVMTCPNSCIAIFCPRGRAASVHELFSYMSATLRFVGALVSTSSAVYASGAVFRLIATLQEPFSVFVFSVPGHVDFFVQDDCLRQYGLLR